MSNLFTKLRVLVAIVAVVLTAIFAFTPLLNVSLTNDEKVERKMSRVVSYAYIAEAKNEGEINEEKYKEIEDYFAEEENYVSNNVISFVKTFPNTVKFYEAFSNMEEYEDLLMDLEMSNGQSDEYVEKLYGKIQASKNKLDKIDYNAITIDSLNQFKWIVTGFGSLDILENNTTVIDMLSMILTAFVKFILAFLILVMFPLVMVFTVIKLLGAILKKDNNKIMLISRGTFSWTALLLAISAIWNGTLTATGVLLVTVTSIAIVFNIVSSWLVNNTERNAKILASTQAYSFISAIGIFMLISNVIKADLGGVWTTLVSLRGTSDTETNLLFASLFVILLSILMPVAYTTIVSLLALAGKVDNGISGKKKKEGGVGVAVVFGIIVLALNVVLRSKYAIEMTAEQSSAVVMAWVGIGLVIIASIVMSVVKSALKNK